MGTRGPSRFIPGDALDSVVEWDFGAVDPASSRFAAKLKAQAEEEERSRHNASRDAGYAEGFAAGHADGYARGILEGNQKLDDYIAHQGQELAQSVAKLLLQARHQLTQSEEVLARGVLDLACEVARQVLRQELSQQPAALLPVVREAVQCLSVDTHVAVLRVNPSDLDALAEPLRQEMAGLELTLVSDVQIEKGGCLIETKGAVVDATVATRWRQAVAKLGLESA